MGGRIEFTPLVLIDTLESYVEVVLEALGYPEALVTDLSTIGDFGFEDDERSAAGDNLGLALVDDDYVYEMARRLRDKGGVVSSLRKRATNEWLPVGKECRSVNLNVSGSSRRSESSVLSTVRHISKTSYGWNKGPKGTTPWLSSAASVG